MSERLPRMGNMARVVEEYNPPGDQTYQLQVAIGDLVEIFERSECQMWLGVNIMDDQARKNTTEGRGWIPERVVQIVEEKFP